MAATQPLPALVGIGVTFKRDKTQGCYVVRRVLENGPAGMHGDVEPGDVFDQVDGIAVATKSPEELTKLVLGPAGSRVDLGVIRNGRRLAVTIRRAEINYDASAQAPELHRIRARQERREERDKVTRGRKAEVTIGTRGIEKADPEAAAAATAAAAAAADAATEAIARLEQSVASPQAMHVTQQQVVSNPLAPSAPGEGHSAMDTRIRRDKGGNLVQPPQPPRYALQAQSQGVSRSPQALSQGLSPDSHGRRTELIQQDTDRRRRPTSPTVDPDGQIEHLAAMALQSKTPPKMSHAMLLELAGVTSDRSSGDLTQRSRGSVTSVGCDDLRELAGEQSWASVGSERSGEMGRSVVGRGGGVSPSQRHTPPQRHESSRARVLAQATRESGGVREARSMGYQNVQKLQQSHEQHVPDQQRLHQSRGGGGSTVGWTSGAVADGVPAQSGEYITATAGAVRRAGKVEQSRSMAYPPTDPELRNLEIYRAVADANANAGGGVAKEESWNSVDSDRQLALKLQTEEVMQHSMSHEWSQSSLGSGLRQGSGLGAQSLSQHSFKSDRSIASDESDHNGLQDVDDETLRRLLSNKGANHGRAQPRAAVGANMPTVLAVSPYHSDSNKLANSRQDRPEERAQEQVASRTRIDDADPAGRIIPPGGHARRCVKVWVMRHGTRVDEENPGWKDDAARPYDPPITAQGRAEARQTGLMLRHIAAREGTIHSIVASPFLRCLQTATEVAKILGIDQIGIDHGLCEVLNTRNVSMRPTYLTTPELAAHDASLAHWAFSCSAQSSPAWPEELAHARARFNEAFTRIPSGVLGNVLLVAHGDTVAQFVAFSRGVPEDSVYSVPHCAAAGAELELTQAPGGGVTLNWHKCRLLGDVLVLDDAGSDDDDYA